MIRTGKKFSKPEMSRVINGDTVIPKAPDEPEKVRLDVLMAEYYKSYNRSTLQKFIESGFVTVEGEMARKANQRFPRGVHIELTVPDVMKNADLVPEVIYEDDDVVVLNKPAGMLSEPRAQYCPEKTLADFGLVVHRLDRDTSGVVVLAKSEEVRMYLKQQFRDRKVHKTYNAIVIGVLKLDEARIDLPLIRNLKRPTTFLVDANGKPSETFYKVLKSNGELSLVELRPTTGRTHQLRVHMNYLGHPILGDVVYGGEKKLHELLDGREDAGNLAALKRLYLHARQLEIVLPDGKRRVFVADLPQEFEDVFRLSK